MGHLALGTRSIVHVVYVAIEESCAQCGPAYLLAMCAALSRRAGCYSFPLCFDMNNKHQASGWWLVADG